MDVTQLAYLAALSLAILAGKPRLLVVAVMFGNFIWTASFAESPIDVALADIACAVILIGSDKRQNIVAAIFCLMIPVYVVADAFGLSRAATYTAIDLLAVVQLAVIGHVDGGLRRIGRAAWPVIVGRPYPLRDTMAARGNASVSSQPVSSERVTHGRE